LKTSLKPIQISKLQSQKSIAVIGGGVVGSLTAFNLAKLGHKVSLIEPRLNKVLIPANERNGTEASLGVLMGNIYRKTSGRSWRLRKRSMELWPKLLIEISKLSNNVKINSPLIQFATSEKEKILMEQLVHRKKSCDIRMLEETTTRIFSEIFNNKIETGLISHNDGLINPKKLLFCLMQALNIYNVEKIDQSVIKLKRSLSFKSKKWQVILGSKENLEKDIVIICAALGSKKLLAPLGHLIDLEPIVGQVLDLEIDIKYNTNISWPAVINYKKYNLILKNKNRMLVGATVEKGTSPKKKFLADMLQGINVDWIENAVIKNQWHGIRARPVNEPSPIIRDLEPNLLVNTGHYRNGFLLAPACAEWVAQKISQDL
tara:strand:- start:1254 stop:2375 length:1122 start_codon:yes stop_codon:yes gene_type:complete